MKSCSLCDGSERLLVSTGLITSAALGVGLPFSTFTVVVLPANSPGPNAKASEPIDSTPSTAAAMILFLSFGDFPSKIFITAISLLGGSLDRRHHVRASEIG